MARCRNYINKFTPGTPLYPPARVLPFNWQERNCEAKVVGLLGTWCPYRLLTIVNTNATEIPWDSLFVSCHRFEEPTHYPSALLHSIFCVRSGSITCNSKTFTTRCRKIQDWLLQQIASLPWSEFPICSIDLYLHDV